MKSFAIVMVVLLVIACVAVFIRDYVKTKRANEEQAKLEYETKLEKAYKKETFALGMDKRYSEYQDFSHVVPNLLTINLEAYEENQPDAQKVTIEDVRNFLADEYDADGNLRVLNQPQNISDYIDWYWSGGDTYTRNYASYLSKYKDDHQDKYQDVSVYEMDLELLNNLIDDFKNCPNKEDYVH